MVFSLFTIPFKDYLHYEVLQRSADHLLIATCCLL